MKKNHSFKRAAAFAIAGALTICSSPVQAAGVGDGEGQKASYVYGTVNLPYADYYYVEALHRLKNVLASTKLQTDN